MRSEERRPAVMAGYWLELVGGGDELVALRAALKPLRQLGDDLSERSAVAAPILSLRCSHTRQWRLRLTGD